MTGKKLSEDLQSHKPSLDVAQCIAAAKEQSGKSYGAQVKEMWKLSRKTFKIAPQDYFYFGLYDDKRFSEDEKQRFISDKDHYSIIQKCCDPTWWALADDKHFSYTLLNAYGAPVPETQAVFSRKTRNFGETLTLRDENATRAFLANEASFPIFVKPNGGIGSFGTFWIESFDEPSDELILAGGDRLPLASFINQIDGEEGYLFQTTLEPHADIAGICSGKVSTVRVILILQDGKPEIIQTVWKIPGPESIADNFWRKGNMLGAVETETGEISRVIQGYGPQMQESPAHPVTAEQIQGIRLPHWDAIKALCLNYAPVFEKLRYQSWDIAICPEGPVVVEVNTGSAFNLSQLATGKGFMTDRFKEFLESCGYF